MSVAGYALPPPHAPQPPTLSSFILFRASPLTFLRLVPGPCKNLQFLPKTSSNLYPVNSQNPSLAYTIGLSIKLGSDMQKHCWEVRRASTKARDEEVQEGEKVGLEETMEGSLAAEVVRI